MSIMGFPDSGIVPEPKAPQPDNTIDSEVDVLLARMEQPDPYHSRRNAIKYLIAEEANKARLEEIEALYARADKDPVLRDKLDELYKMRYINMGGSNIFIADRLTADKEQA